jgi:sporulation-control protein spo0M
MSNGISNTITWGTTTVNTSPWTVGTSSSGPYTISADPNLKGASLLVGGDAEFEGDVKIKGKSLTKLIDNIEQRLAILHPNEKLEAKWEKLKTLGEQYREMEKEILHAEEMWKILKK